MRQLRPYQIDALEAVNNALAEGITKQILVLPTGAGKTFCASQIVKPMGKILWVTHTEELIEQSAEVLSRELDCPHGIIKQQRLELDYQVVVASVQTLWRRLDFVDPKLFNVIVLDECHYAGSNSWTKVIEHFTPKLLLGLTATPYRTDGMMLGDIFDKIVFDYPIDQAIKDGYLCEIEAIRIKTNISLDKVKTIAGDLNQGDLEEIINTPERNSLIVNKYLQYAAGRQFLAFCVDVRHAIDLADAFKEKGVKCDFIVGDKDLTTDRKGVINALRTGEVDGLTNVMVLTAGFDHPNIGCVIAACPTKSLTKYLQQIGRGTRLKDANFVEKFGQNVIILDIVDVTSRHRLVNTWELDRQKPLEERVFISSATKEKIAEARQRKMASVIEKEERVKLIALPRVKVIHSERMKEPATEAQLQWIKQLGYDTENDHYTKQMCNEIISNLPASHTDFCILRDSGYDVSRGVTRAEAQIAVKEIKARIAKENAKKYGK